MPIVTSNTNSMNNSELNLKGFMLLAHEKELDTNYDRNFFLIMVNSSPSCYSYPILLSTLLFSTRMTTFSSTHMSADSYLVLK